MTRLKTYAQLVRLPNVFTALADIFLGWLAMAAVTAEHDAAMLPWLLAASACLYSAGMVLNDVCDVAQDRRERPHRPIPSGRVSRSRAAVIAFLLLLIGCGAAAIVGAKSLLVAGILAVCIVAYDSFGKRTWLGPVLMGGCRFLNVLLACSAGPDFPVGWMFHLAAIVGIYIVGVTLFARTEAVASKRGILGFAVGLMALAPLLALPLMATLFPDTSRGTASVIALLVWIAFLALPLSKALLRPEPRFVQAAVKRCIFGLIGLDAILALAVYGWAGLLILLLIIPAIVLGRYVYST